MQRRNLGGLEVSAIGLGCMSMTPIYGEPSEPEAIATVHRAAELGVDLIDTSDAYGNGANEELVGRAIKGRRSQVVLATKFGNMRDEEGRFKGINGRPDYVRRACEASLHRLQVETIDLYYQHRVDRTVPIEDTVGAMSRLVEQGKVRFLGLSEAAPGTVRRAHRVHPISALQTEYSLWTRDVEEELIPACRTLAVTFVAYSPLGRGFLTGRIKRYEDLAADDWRRNNPRFQGDNFDRNLELVRRLEEMATEKTCKPSQLALAWVLARGDQVVPIPGTTRRAHLEENLAALEITLTPDDVARLDEVAPQGVAAGDRYPEGGMQVVNG